MREYMKLHKEESPEYGKVDQLTDDQLKTYAQLYLYLRDGIGYNNARPHIINPYTSRLYNPSVYTKSQADVSILAYMLNDECNAVGERMRGDMTLRNDDESFNQQYPGVLDAVKRYPYIDDRGLSFSSYWLSDECTEYCWKIAKQNLIDRGVSVDLLNQVEYNPHA